MGWRPWPQRHQAYGRANPAIVTAALLCFAAGQVEVVQGAKKIGIPVREVVQAEAQKRDYLQEADIADTLRRSPIQQCHEQPV